MATKKSAAVRKAEADAEKLEAEAEKMASRQGARFLDPIDVDQNGPYTPGPTGTPDDETQSVMAERHPELFQPKEELVEEEEGKNYATFNYKMSYLMADPTQRSRVVKILNQDDRLELLGEDEDGWIKVRSMTHPQVEGYVKTVFVKGD